MSIYVELFLAFFIPNIIGYGGGPATIPLIKHEVVVHYGWLTLAEYSDILALFGYIALERWKLHPAFVIAIGLCVGGLFLA